MSVFQTHIGELSQLLIDTIKEAEVTQNVYIEHGPAVDDNTPDDFCIVTYPLTLRHKGPIQLHDVRIELVVKDLKSKRANIIGIEDRMNKLLAKFPIVGDRHTLSNPYLRLKGENGLGHTSWTLQCDCIVNTTDAIGY